MRAAQPNPRRTAQRLELALICVVLLVAAFFRLYRLDEVPAGIYFDIAFNAKDARDVLAGHFPIFFPRNNGREALFIYFQALILRFNGFRLSSFTFSSAFMGVLGVATTYRLWKALFGWRVALLSAALLAVFFWDVNLSRLGFRVISLLPFVNATLYLLWRTVRTGRWSYASLAGLCLGLSLYTYTAARLVPVLVVACLLSAWPLVKARLAAVACVALVAGATVAPEAAYFLRHPSEFMDRIQAVSLVGSPATTSDAGSAVINGLVRTGGMFFVRGDSHPLYNLIDRPIFEPWQAVIFLVGIGLVMIRIRHSMAARWALCCFVVMLLPSALSAESPSYMRALGASPAAFLFPAAAIDAASRLVPRSPVAYGLLGLSLALTSAVQNFGLYFDDWANNADTFGATDVSRLHMASFVAQRPESRVYFADTDFSGNIVRALVPTTEQDGWIPEPSSAIPVPSRLDGDTLYIGVPGAALNDIAPAWLPGAQALPQPLTPFGKPEFVAFSWSRSDATQLVGSLSAVHRDFGDFELVGYRLLNQTNQGVSVEALWRPLHADGPYDIFVHLLDQGDAQVSQSDRLAWPAKTFDNIHEGEGLPKWGYYDEGRESDDWLLTQHQLDAPPGNYVAEVGVARRDPQDPTKVSSSLGTFRVPVSVGAQS